MKAFHDDFRSIHAEADRLVDGLTEEQFNWRPAPDRWSIAQCLDHLNVAGYLLLPRLEHAVHRARAVRQFSDRPLRYGWMGNWFIRSQQPGPNMRKMKAPGVFTPSIRAAVDEVVPRFKALQHHLMGTVEEADGLDLARIKVSSPVNGLIRLNVGAWFAATAAHEHRHLVQARAVREAEGFPGGDLGATA